MLTYPASWGPTEWGPIPFLPERDVLVANMERQWGQLDSYRGISTSAAGDWLLQVSCLPTKHNRFCMRLGAKQRALLPAQGAMLSAQCTMAWWAVQLAQAAAAVCAPGTTQGGLPLPA